MIYCSYMHRVDVALHEIFQSLADPYRIRIMRLMLETRTEVCLCELSEALEEPEYKLSRHLKILKSGGLITSVREGKWIYHSLVKNQKYLRAIHKSLQEFSDEGILEKDLSRFNKRLKLREAGKCRLAPREKSTDARQANT